MSASPSRVRWQPPHGRSARSSTPHVVDGLPGATAGPRRFYKATICCQGAASRCAPTKRPRRPLPGMMLHQDASRHAWLPQAPPLDLVVTMDDETSEIYSVLLVEEEGTAEHRVPNVIQNEQEAPVAKNSSQIDTCLGHGRIIGPLSGHRACQHG